jgi:hypothetical protein
MSDDPETLEQLRNLSKQCGVTSEELNALMWMWEKEEAVKKQFELIKATQYTDIIGGSDG